MSSFLALDLRVAVILLCALVVDTRADEVRELSWVWFDTEVAEGTASRWCRFVFNHTGASADVRVAVATPETASIYVNGQRLLRHASLKQNDGSVRAAGFDVTPLLRTGRNCVALEIQSASQKSVAAVSITSHSTDRPATPVKAEWKAVSRMPPVGWQQTDFNDRDWAKADPLTNAPESAFVLHPPLAWQPVAVARQDSRVPLQWQDGDHVVLLGSTFLEREQQFGHIEAVLSGSAGSRRVTFRNLGWDGDTVFAESRGIFDSPEVGYLRMIEHIRAEEPTVIVVCYGQNDALINGRSVEHFATQLNRLLDDLSLSGATVLLMSPHELFPTAAPIPSPSRFNPRLATFTEALQQTATSRSLQFVNLFHDFTNQLAAADGLLRIFGQIEVLPDPRLHPDLWATASTRWTDNGMHLNDEGYRTAALVVRDRLLSIPAQRPVVRINSQERTVTGELVEIRNINWEKDAQTLVQFQLREQFLSPLPVTLQFAGDDALVLRQGTAESADQTTPLLPGSMDESQTSVSSAAAQAVLFVPCSPQYQQLLTTVMRKNELYFHRWRPQNITYLFGFRKHEQGNNAVEIAQFDPLIRTLEDQIAALQQPGWTTITVTAGQPSN